MNFGDRAREEADKCWTKKSKNRQNKENCNTLVCIIFPIEEENKYDTKVKWDKCENELHLRWESLVDYEEEKTEHTCNRCEDGSEKDQRNKIREAQTNVDSDQAAVERNVQEIET